MPQQLVFGLLRLAASAMVLVGVCSFVAALPLVAIVDGGVTAAFIRAAVAVGGIFLVAGVAVLYVARPNRQAQDADANGWPGLLALTLVLIAAVMIARLGPLAALWKEALVLMDEGKVWENIGAGADLSAIVLLPIAAALTVPALAVGAASAFVFGAIVLLILAWQRSPSLPRAYVSCFLIQSALVIATIYGASLTRRAGDAIEREIKQQDGRNEAGEILDRLRRYDFAIASTATTLAWTLGAYAVGLVPIVTVLRANPANEGIPAHRATSPDQTDLER